MNNPNVLPSSRFSVQGHVEAQNAAAVVYSECVALADFENFLGVVIPGDFAQGAKLDAALQRCTDSNGSNAADISGKTITQILDSASPTTDPDRVVEINLRASEAAGEQAAGVPWTHVRLRVTPSVGNVYVSGLLFGVDPRQYPPTAPSTVVAEIVE